MLANYVDLGHCILSGSLDVFPSQYIYMYTVVILCPICHKCSVQSFVMTTGEGQDQFTFKYINQ